MGNVREKAETTKHTSQGQFDKYQFAVSHMCGWRLYMEDAHICSTPFGEKKLGLFGVFDGHGGPECAIFVERHFAKELRNNKNFKEGKYEKALKETFLKMDQLLITEQGKAEIISIWKEEEAKKNAPQYTGEPSHAGCTANVVLITPGWIYCANSGDSRAVALISKKTVALSEDHKPEDPKEYNRIIKAGGTVEIGRVNGNLNLTRALGDLEYKENENLPPQEQIITADPDISKFQNKNVEFIIMGCDGIWEVKSNEEMVKWVSKRLLNEKKALGSILEQLLDSLVSKNGETQSGMDNMSAILIAFKPK